jgi:pimeloyl-ACP methyl ester carboxylesterase
MPYLTADDGVRLFYTDEGSGPPMVLVHAFTGDSSDWSWVIPELRENFRVIAYDRRGEGRSDEGSSYTLGRQVADLVAVINELECEAPVVIGHSIGTAIASSLSVEHPGMARAIVVVDPPYAASEAYAAAADAMKDRLAGPGYREALKEFWNALCYTPASPPWLRTMVTRRIDALSQEALLGTYLGLWDDPSGIARQPQSDEYLRRRSEPVLALYSSQTADHERSLFTDSESHAIEWPGSGHWMQVERPQEFVTVVTRWLDGLAA